MVQTLVKPVTFAEFVNWDRDRLEQRYELHNGVVTEMPNPTGKHSKIAGFLARKLNVLIDHQGLNCFIPKECLVKPLFKESGYYPDVIVLDEMAVNNEPQWSTGSIITIGTSVRLIIEVVSTNWQDDYTLKSTDYEEMGINEYWIVDYLGLGGRRFIGTPKQPTISILTLVDNEYQVNLFQGEQALESCAFPDFKLTPTQIFQS